MSEPTLIQEQRVILRRLREATAQHVQLTTDADAQWREVQHAYEKVRARLAEVGEEQVLRGAVTRPPVAQSGTDPAATFRSSAVQVIQVAQDLRSFLATPFSWRQHTAWTAHGRPLLGIGVPYCVVAFSPDGRLLASGSSDKTMKVWEVASGALLRTLEGHTWSVNSVAFSPDGRALASASWDNTIRLWDAASRALLRTLEGHTFWLRSVAFSPDGRTLASGSADNTIRLWDAAGGALLRTLAGHTGDVHSVAFSPDGRLLASGSEDNTIRLWDAASGALLRTLEGHTYTVNSVAFSPDGRALASGSWDGTVRLWGVR